MTQPSNKAPESPSPNGLTESDEGRIIRWAIEYAAKFSGQYYVNTYDLRMAAQYATLYEREQSAAKDNRIKQLEADNEQLRQWKLIAPETPKDDRKLYAVIGNGDYLAYRIGIGYGSHVEWDRFKYYIELPPVKP